VPCLPDYFVEKFLTNFLRFVFIPYNQAVGIASDSHHCYNILKYIQTKLKKERKGEL